MNTKEKFYLGGILVVFLMLVLMCIIIGRVGSLYDRLAFPTIATTATYHITVRPGGHVWLYEGGAYDMKLEPGAVIHEKGK